MSNQNPKPDDRKLIPIWIQEEESRRVIEEQPPQLAVDPEIATKIEELLKTAIKDIIKPEILDKTKSQARDLLIKGIEKTAEKREREKLPTQYEREQSIMNFRRFLPSNRSLISPNMLENREDIFKPRVRNEAEVKSGFNNQEENPDVNRVENWSIWAYAQGINGGDACWSSLYWRYRIWVPDFDTSIQSDRRLVVTPMAVLSGYYDLFSIPVPPPILARPNALVRLDFGTGTWHWHYTGSSYEPEWTGWRISLGVVYREIIYLNAHQDISVPYPGTEVRTPARFDPPGVSTSPNPRNNYGMVKPFDVVDFYVRPRVCAITYDPISYARLDFSLIDVPFVVVDFETGYPL